MRVQEMLRLTALAVAVVALLAVPSPLAADDDGQLELKTRLTLLQKLGVDGMRVDVRAADGNVLLAGTVKKRETLELAESVVKSLEGVTRVDNQIELAEYEKSGEKTAVAASETERELSDAGLQARVKVALIDRLGRDGFRIGTDAAGGTVTLEFPADLADDRRADAARIARAVDGVEKVIELRKP